MRKYTVLQDGKPFLTGTRKEITDKLYMDPKYFYKIYETKKMYLGRYEIVKFIKEEKKKAKEKSETEKTMDYLVWHLKYMGITNLNENPEKYIKPLEELGFEGVTYREYGVGKDKDYILEWKK